MELVRLATAGSVDDGKSTLLGRLLLESKAICDDHLHAVERVSASKGFDYTDLALLTDGLRSEREQGITIDVAYRYFATPKRSFILADTPGHIQYTRNMVTGASNADIGIVLVDARHGFSEQSRRHCLLLGLLGVQHVIIAVNKMDLIDYSQPGFEQVRAQAHEFVHGLTIGHVDVVPICALLGDNITEKSQSMLWYQGPTLMWLLENTFVGGSANSIGTRVPVQLVIRPGTAQHHDFRGYAGQIAGGTLSVGDAVVSLPSGLESVVERITIGGKPVERAESAASIVVELQDDIDVARGDMICRVGNRPQVGQDIDAMVAWFGNSVLKPGAMVLLQQATRLVRAKVLRLNYRLDVNSLHRDPDAESLTLNEVGRVKLRTTEPIVWDAYAQNKTTGSFILIDPVTNNTVAAGMIRQS